MQLSAIVNYTKDILMSPPYRDGMSDLEKATAYLEYISKGDTDKNKIIVHVLDNQMVKYTYNAQWNIPRNIYPIPRNISAIFDNLVNGTLHNDNFMYVGPFWSPVEVMKICIVINYTLEGLMFTPYKADMSDLEKATAHLNWRMQDSYFILKDKITVEVIDNKHAKYTYNAESDSSSKFTIPANVSGIFDIINHRNTDTFMYIEL